MSTQTVAVQPARKGAIETADDGAGRADERELIRRASAGDRAAFEVLYRDNMRRVYALCLRLSSDPALADELAQDVFVRAWERLGTFRGESAFFSWLYPLAVNVALSEWRSRSRRTARVMITDDLTPFDTAAPTARPDVALDLERAMAVLPAGARAVFVLHDVEGRKHEEIAELLGVAVGTSKAQLHRARKMLREVLER